MKAIAAILSALIMCISFTACQNAPEPTDKTQSIETETKSKNIDFSETLDEIYKDCNIFGLTLATDEDMEELFEFDLSQIEDYTVKFSSKNYGVADIFIIKPKEEFEQDIFENLRKIKDRRVDEFENYIIYDSLSIAKNAEIYSRGDYIIMLMIQNQDQAKELINKLIDKN